MPTNTLLRSLLIFGFILIFAACDRNENNGETAEAAAADEQEERAASDYEVGEFYAEKLDDLDFPDHGKARLVLAGETFEGEIDHCVLKEKYRNPRGILAGDQYNVSLRSTYEAEGQRIRIRGMQAMLLDPADFGGPGGLDFQEATLAIHADIAGDRSISGKEATVVTSRAEPGAESSAYYGEGDSPLLKVQFDGEVLRATATGTMRGLIGGSSKVNLPHGGEFTFAASCDAEVER